MFKDAPYITINDVSNIIGKSADLILIPKFEDF